MARLAETNSYPTLILVGPTGVGKSALAHQLARWLNGEIISADSVQIYRGMEKGTAKPSTRMRAEVSYHLLDILDPSQTYSVARFIEDAHRSLAKIRARGRVAIIVGGTMLYVDALLHGISVLPPTQPAMRTRYAVQAQKEGWESLHRKLEQLDEMAARRIHKNDHQRILRALEVAEQAGSSMSLLQKKQERCGLYSEYATRGDQIFIGVLNFSHRELLHSRLAMRFRNFIEHGLVEEVRQLKARGDLSLECPSMRAVGYRQIWEYLNGLFDYEEMLARGIAATRQLAKRQLTWLRNWGEPVYALDAGVPTKQLMQEMLAQLRT